MKTKLRDGEIITWKGMANWKKDSDGLGGHLYLTNRRLVFETHFINAEHCTVEIDLPVLSTTRQWSKILGVPIVNNSISVKPNKDEEYIFIVFDAATWIEKLACASTTTFPDDSLKENPSVVAQEEAGLPAEESTSRPKEALEAESQSTSPTLDELEGEATGKGVVRADSVKMECALDGQYNLEETALSSPTTTVKEPSEQETAPGGTAESSNIQVLNSLRTIIRLMKLIWLNIRRKWDREATGPGSEHHRLDDGDNEAQLAQLFGMLGQQIFSLIKISFRFVFPTVRDLLLIVIGIALYFLSFVIMPVTMFLLPSIHLSLNEFGTEMAKEAARRIAVRGVVLAIIIGVVFMILSYFGMA